MKNNLDTLFNSDPEMNIKSPAYISWKSLSPLTTDFLENEAIIKLNLEDSEKEI